MVVVATNSSSSSEASAAVDWRSWGRSQWNVELFHHYFDVTADDHAATRLSLGPDELASIVESGADPIEVKAAFEFAIREGCSVGVLKRRLSLEAHTRWSGIGIPPYVVDLLFTCYAAGLVDEDTADVGDFRERLRLLLHHPEGTSYHLPHLSALWECFKEWLDHRRAAGDSYRALKLPYYGHENLIGYSKRLVFPLLRDRRILVNVLAKADFGPEPPLLDVLMLLSHESQRFTEPFQSAIKKARTAYQNAQASEDLDVLWSAVREVAALAGADAPRPAVRYQLFAAPDEEFKVELTLMANVPPKRVPRGLDVIPSSVRLGEYEYLVVQRNESRMDPAGAVRLLLAGALDNALVGFERSTLRTIAAQGVLLFALNVDGTRELVSHRPDDGRVWALITDQWVASMFELFPATDRPAPKPSHYSGWTELGPFDAAYLARVDQCTNNQIARVRCLQPTRIGQSIHLSGGVRVDGGYLGLRGVLPTVRVTDVERVVAFWPANVDHVQKPTVTLLPAPDDETLFRFPRHYGDGLEGRLNLVAYHRQTVVATRQIVLRARVLASEFLTPTDSSRFWVESNHSDVVSAADANAQAPWSRELVIGQSAHISELTDHRFSTLASARHTQALSADAILPLERRVDDDEGVDRLVEWAAGLAAVRRGLTEGELLDMVETCLGPSELAVRWNLLRAWCEVGWFDVLTRRDWRGRMWFAQPPRLVLVRSEPHLEVSLTGITSWATRRRAEKILAEHGAVPLPSLSITSLAPMCLRWAIADVDTTTRAAQALDLAPPRILDDPPSAVTRVSVVAEHSVGERPSSGELRGRWNWEQSRFQPCSADSGRPTSVEWWGRENGPDYFVIRAAEAGLWWTPSRNWALLVAYSYAGVDAFDVSGERLLVCTGKGGPYLPLPVARAVALHSGIAPGPINRRDGRHAYAYAFADPRERAALFANLWRDKRDLTRVARKIRWLLRIAVSTRAARSNQNTLSLRSIPIELRRILANIDGIPEAAELGASELPAHLIPHVRRLVAEATD